ncbi:MAG: hypothetical protein R2792_10670 [Saprospiraceae bacterium]
MNLNTQFVFEGKLKRNLIIGMAIGVVCLILSAMGDDDYLTRFWTNYLHNAVFFTGIAFTMMFFLAANITAFGGWITTFKRLWESMSQFMWVGILLMIPLVAGVWGHFHHLYHWNTPGITDPNNPIYDRIIAGKSGFLNPMFYTVGVIGFLAIWYYWAMKLRQTSVDQDTMETASLDYYKKQRKWAATFLPIGGFLSTVFLWELVMSIDSHWYSTMFAWYATISVFLAGLTLTVMLIIYLKGKGYMQYVTREHIHDLGKYVFGISVFWTYLWFDQFMLIWYANVGEETIYFKERMDHYPVLFWGNLLLNFILPFFILMRNDTKRKMGTMFIVAAFVFFGHWWDYFYMIKPGARIAAFEAKELAEGKHSSNHEAAPIHEGEGDHAAMTHEGENHEAAGEHADVGHGEEASAAVAHGGHEAEGHHEGGEDHHGHPTHFQIGYTLPGLAEIGVMIGFLCGFLFFLFSHLQKASLLPLKDPYLEESLHHETGVYPDNEEKGDSHH